MLTLPPELLPLILSYLPLPSLHALSLTCRTLHRHVTDTLKLDSALQVTCTALAPWIHSKPHYLLWRDVLNEIQSRDQDTPAHVTHIDTLTLTPTHRFVPPKRRPKIHQDSQLRGYPLFRSRDPTHVHELGAGVSGHVIYLHDVISTSEYQVDVSTLLKKPVSESRDLNWGFPRFIRESTGYKYTNSSHSWHFHLEGEFLDDLYALNCGKILYAILVGVQSGGVYFLQVEMDQSEPVVLFLPSLQTHNPIPPRAQLQQSNGAVFATVCFPEGEVPEMFFLDFAGHVIYRLFSVSSRDLNCALMVRSGDLYVVLGGELVRVRVEFGSHVSEDYVTSSVSYVSKSQLTKNHVTQPSCSILSISSLSCDSLRYRAHLDLDCLFGKYALLWNSGGFAALLDLDSHVITKLQNDTDMLSLVAWKWHGEEGEFEGRGEVNVGRYTVGWLKGLE